ncbi:MAG: 50S ribosomal protein L27 [Candidatus Kerfeldbacteria bacterium CG15_BIG_FIL_POST_REV_8_21_14_020_45_12]|uniref:Large ribosomal subunit protein bL27 n=1 Tax=Candidatus Kerfeldbacteria bacterium CG15_BIG_FIL_POST_REV_8_21_14_020_45_12 TaxID=2014247 RepID=A0A2M7H294_9BACT|nr:MAG: 50S ribosomal protein L27 [Candidatus Kerfeldbacteria bacterium CG15_BIG_FIL_POST_REV_8_21_14_020_45_12]PJA93732.1 MAG: 50S ribosomal protein L27 [Candidatus Kerfeldbacteria bacterium CG_4_9_14_3_um_filter_45_8]
MAHTKAGGSTSLGRDSVAKRLGVKKFGGQAVNAGNIIIRQRGSKYRPGPGTRQGEDDTIYATQPGVVLFSTKKQERFTGKLHKIRIVSVVEAK